MKTEANLQAAQELIKEHEETIEKVQQEKVPLYCIDTAYVHNLRY